MTAIDETRDGDERASRHILRELGFVTRRAGEGLEGTATVTLPLLVPGLAHLRTSILATWADTMGGLLAIRAFAPRVPVTLELDVDLLRPAPGAGAVRGAASVAKAGRSVFVFEAEFTDDDGLFAVAAGSFMASPDPGVRMPSRLPPPAPAAGLLKVPLARTGRVRAARPGRGVAPAFRGRAELVQHGQRRAHRPGRRRGDAVAHARHHAVLPGPSVPAAGARRARRRHRRRARGARAGTSPRRRLRRPTVGPGHDADVPGLKGGDVFFGLRFDFRNPAFAATAMADRYAAALDMAAWADGLGCVNIAVSEHHGSPDGYLPSPIPMLAAMAARTTTVPLMIAALIAPFHDPLRLAEDLILLDNLSRGRVDLIVAAGYVEEEFAIFDVPMRERAQRVTETVATLRAAFTGEPFEYRGRTVHLTPAPFRPGGPRLLLGGSSEAAARRAARIADGFVPSDPSHLGLLPRRGHRAGTPRPGTLPHGGDESGGAGRGPRGGLGADGPLLPARDERLRRLAGA